MASVPGLLRRIRRARRESKQQPSSRQFERYESEYETVLGAVEELGGETALEEVGEWAIESARNRERLPRPDRLRERARETLASHGVEIPPDSPLVADR